MSQIAELDGEPTVGDVGEFEPLTSIPDILRLIGNGAGGPILMTLGPSPLRTQQLTRRLNHLSPRTAYRHIGNLAEHGLVRREVEPGVPSRVKLSLTDPLGRNLCQLLSSFVAITMDKLPRRGDGAEPWEALALLGEFWELGLIEDLSHGPTSVIDLARAAHPMTYHQVSRRAGLFATYGLGSSYNSNGNGKCYELTNEGRRCMGLIVAIGRWRQRHILRDGISGLTIGEMATALRTVLPVVVLPEYCGMSIDFEVSESMNGSGYRAAEVLRAQISQTGTIRWEQRPQVSADGSAAATINTWFGVLLDGNRGRVKVRGDLPLVDACLTRLHDTLWKEEAGFSRLPDPAADSA